jgi:MFS family permease
MSPRAIWAIGFGQLVNWGVLYYAFAVLLVPLEQSLRAPRWAVAGAFSVGLLVSAAAAPAVGRLTDRGQGPAVMQAGGLLAAGALLGWAAAPSVWMTYVVWAALGLCMAAILYEPVFVIVGRAFAEGDARLRAIATVTVLGGLASTVFLPSTSAIVDRWGWRGAVVVLAGVIATTTLIVGRIAFRDQAWSAQTIRDALAEDACSTSAAITAPGLKRFVAVFALSSIVNSALAANLVAALIDRELTPTFAAMIAGLFGVLQLPGRLLMTNRTFSPGPLQLLIVSFALQVAGLLALMVNGATTMLWLGVMLFAGGAGLTTLARPYLVLHMYGADRAGLANGVIARAQQLARAGGPVFAALIATVTGYGKLFAGLATLLAVAMMLTMKARS